jgi:hypothetical protein
MDFYTTLGTGKMGGNLYPGTFTDVCYVDNPDSPFGVPSNRIPYSSTDAAWRVLPRTFTEGQGNQTSRARLKMDLYSTVGTRASATVAFAGVVAGNYITIGMNNLVGINPGPRTPGLNDFDIFGLTKTELEAAINDPLNSFYGLVDSPITVLPDLTIRALKSGVLGNSILLGSSANFTPSSTHLINGVDEGTTFLGATFDIHLQDGTIVTFTGVHTAERSPSSLVQFETQGSLSEVAEWIALKINANTTVNPYIWAWAEGSSVWFEAKQAGTQGNLLRITTTPNVAGDFILRPPVKDYENDGTAAYLFGGIDVPVNAGSGVTRIGLTGLTERLPLGILTQDSDFLGEAPLRDASSQLNACTIIRPIQNVLDFSSDEEFSRFLGTPGERLVMSDGAIQEYTAYDATSAPTGTKRFRLYRGGGSVFMGSGVNPGGPVDWVSSVFSKESNPVLKGAILAGKALLVRNFREEAFTTNNVVSQGDEIQLVVLTQSVYGSLSLCEDGWTLSGIISPTGYGDGYAASDRYRLEGKPMYKSASREVVDPDTFILAPYLLE